MKIDLHCHSNCSDGALSVEQLIDRACSLDVKILALTDHDTINGVEQAMHIAADRLKIIPALELSVTWNDKQIHIVGLGIDIDSTALIDLINEQNQRRKERALNIGKKLEKLGFKDAYANTKALSGSDDSIITRGNYARYLYSIKAACSVDDAFNTYLKQGKKAYVKTQWVSLQNGIAIIKQSGGIAVLAHPKRYPLTNMKLCELIEDFKSAGGEAMEVSNCGQSLTERDYLSKLCLKYNLLASCGSDFHHEGVFRELGHNIEIPQANTSVLEHDRVKRFL